MKFRHVQLINEWQHLLTYAPAKSDEKSSGASFGDFSSLFDGAPNGTNKLRFGEAPNHAPESALRVSQTCLADVKPSGKI
ncbi:hypothetical protein EDF58_1141 [Novosphingobium sp. PhB57]|uniref:hypothetical protein n=1 Tax=Novosphingobium sp. PhB57 TaxID=2485107 RepID=UPI001042FA97|nr:hypothetical protein [Novosphingobium sp. PhB57]TCU52743.1 hypothetical protein EDF58_1141 [Novosphingobium sp. PhB57]